MSLGLRERLQLRAVPNKRLTQAFGIVNSFTTSDPDIHTTFLLQSRESIQKMTQETWILIFREATEILRRHFKAAVGGADDDMVEPECRLLLAQTVRRLCFTIVFSILFGADPPSMQFQDVDIITREINTQWLLSKYAMNVTKSQSLNSALRRLLIASFKPSTTPEAALTLILPAYETLWRVVLLTYVSAWHRNHNPLDPEGLEGVPECLGQGDDKEIKARQLAKVRLMMASHFILYDQRTQVDVDFI